MALAQRRHHEGNHVKAIIKIFAECFCLNGFFQVFICSCDQAHVYGDWARAAQPLKLALLQNAKQFDL